MTEAETAAKPQQSGKSNWPKWLVVVGAFAGIGAPLLALVMALGTGAGMIGWETSLGSLRLLTRLAMAGLALSVIGLIVILIKRRWGLFKWALPGALVAAGFLFYAGIWFGQMAEVPPIHDVTTDLDSPPTFEALTLREDNREVVPEGSDPRMASMDNAMRWRTYHEEAYGDIQPLIVPTSVPATIEAAEELINNRGWELAVADPATGRIEATESVSLYRFKDDIVLRVTPNPDGEGSIVDMRSVSRVGVSDLGVNAGRVRTFLADLQAATSG